MSFELNQHQQLFLNLYASHYEHVVQQHASLLEQSNRLVPIMNELRHNMHAIYADARADSRVDINRPHLPPFHTMATYSNGLATSAIFTRPVRERELPVVTNRESPVVTNREAQVDDLMITGTTNRIFSEISIPLNTECPISLVPFEPTSEVAQLNRCGHIFVRSELSQWLQTNVRCPTCRANVGQT